MRKRAMSNKKFKVLDLFCGAGGLSRGFIDAGFEVVLGVDFDQNALNTFKLNHDGAEAMSLDLFKEENINVITGFLKENNHTIDVLIGGPPCQGFSLAGPREEGDERNRLYKEMVRLAGLIKPKVVLIENVPGLLTLYEGKAAKRIYSDFENLGYKMQSKILYAPEYGIPQIRKRVFFVATLDGIEFSYPKPIITDSKEYITCEEAIGDLPSRENEIGKEEDVYSQEPKTEYQRYIRDGSKVLHNHLGTNHIEKTKKLIAMVPEGKNFRSLPEEYRKQFKYNEALTRYHSKKPSLTINTGHRSHFHYKYNRVPSVRESARLQSFKDTFVFTGPKTQQYKLVGNAVPPLLGYHLAKEIKKSLEENTSEEK
ncbi:MAG: DNA cytosine methyltransferase [Peptoniphilus harei]|nr:DNA cytosine methyltransferase [Peptoniphilus harei]